MAQRAEIKRDGTQMDRYDPYVVLGRLLGRLTAQDFFSADDLRHQLAFRDEQQNHARSVLRALVDNPENNGNFFIPIRK